MELFNLRYSRAAQRLSDDLRRFVVYGAQDSEKDQIYAAIVSTIDARNYVILGDPAVRLPAVASPGRKKSRRPKNLLVFNGIDGATGDYLLPPLPPEQVAALARGERPDPVHLAELRRRWERVTQQTF